MFMLYLHSAGHAHPNNEITNDFLATLTPDTSTDKLVGRFGIFCRRSVLPLEYIRTTLNQDPRQAQDVATHTPTLLGAAAAAMALERAGILANDLGLVIANCCTPLQTMPAEAQRIAAHLGIDCKAFDVFSSSAGFALHLDYLDGLRPERMPEYTLCVSTATFTTFVNYRNTVDAAIWGDGAAAWIVSPLRPTRGFRIVHTCFGNDPRRWDTVTVDRWGHFRQNGRAVGHYSVGQTVKLLRSLQTGFGLRWNDTYFIGHQANARMLDTVCRSEGIPVDRHLSNVAQIGNQAGAGAPATLSMNWDRIAAGSRLAIAVVGAGLSWGAALLEAMA
jgi:3-oxoacyl-[acyl-carrier-protein] synthase-3